MPRVADPYIKLSSPRIFLVRMLVFITLCVLVGVLIYRQIWSAFLANPGLNGVILGALLIGIIMAIRQVIRLYPEVRWVNSFRLADPGLAVSRPPVLLAPMAAILGDRMGRMSISQSTMRGIMDSIGTRLDESRDVARYLIGLLVFLGLLGTFWGLLDTVGSIGRVVSSLQVGADAGTVFEDLKSGLAAPLSGMAIAFSSSLFGLAGSLILGFLDLQANQAQNRFYTDLEDWLSTTVRDLGVADEDEVRPQTARPPAAVPIALLKEFTAAVDRLERAMRSVVPAASGAAAPAPVPYDMAEVIDRLERALEPLAHVTQLPVDQVTAAIDRLEQVVQDAGSLRASRAMVQLAESLQSLLHHMRGEQQMLRDWVESQAEQQNDIRILLERLSRMVASERM